jgi:First Longin domain of FUZ, MON1 and HPS1/Second Longin domain of FUZ, MON1 and HPS1
MSSWASSASKHVFILTSAGKPVFSRYEENDGNSSMNTIFSVLQAVISRTNDSGDSFSHITTSSDTKIVFYLKASLFYVIVSKTNETVHSLRELLRSLHNHILLTLTSKLLDRLKKQPNLDIRSQISGARPALFHLIRLSNRFPLFLDAIPTLPLPSSTIRRQLLQHLHHVDPKNPVTNQDAGIVYAVFITGYSVAAWIQPKNSTYSLSPNDALLLISLVQSAGALRFGDVLTPICLPSLNDTGYLTAYIAHIQECTKNDSFELLAKKSMFESKEQSDPLVDISHRQSQQGFNESDGVSARYDEMKAPFSIRATSSFRISSPAVLTTPRKSTLRNAMQSSESAADAATSIPSPSPLPAFTEEGSHDSSSAVSTNDVSSPLSSDQPRRLNQPTLSSTISATTLSEEGGADNPDDDAELSPPSASSTIDLRPPHMYLVLVSSLPSTDESTLKALEARKAAILDSFWGSQNSDQLQSIFRTSTSPFNASEISALAYTSPSASSGIPGVLHFLYLWKDSRQFVQARLPLDVIKSHTCRKALYRAYAIAFDALTHPTVPLRHWNFAMDAEGAASKGLQALLEEPDVPSIGAIAGIHTTHAILLAIFAPPEGTHSKHSTKKGKLAKVFGPETSKLPDVMEKLAKFVKKDHERWIITPGNV